MRVLNVGGSPLSNFIEQIEDAARRQGFVLINGDELIDPAQFFASLNDNIEGGPVPECDCQPGFCQSDADDEFEFVASQFGNMMGQAAAFIESEAASEEAALAAEEAAHQDKLGAVAQLGRIIETLTVLVQAHADLVADLVES